jgi:DNA polymerase III subunit epsilon
MTGRVKRRTDDESIDNIPITQGKYVVIDIELTGLDEQRDSIISIGAIRMSGGRIELGETFYRLMGPEGPSMHSVNIQGSTTAGLVLEQDTAPVLADFLSLCGEDVLVGHLIFTDLTFLKNEVRRFFGLEVKNYVIDTYQVYHWLMRREALGGSYSPTEVKLNEVASQLGVTVSDNHDAMSDAFITAQIFQRLMPMLIREGVKTIGELLRIGDPSEGLR